MAGIEIRSASKNYGTVRVLEHIDLTIDDGEFIVLVGPSGCGKSTLLRMIAGLEEITSGEILIDGKVVNNLAPKARDIAMVFQSYALYPHMTVAGNMSYSLRLRRTARQTIGRKIADASSKLGLEALLDRKPKALSGGQRQRVAMGRAIVREPKAFLFDEPLSNLDARLREQMRAEIRKLHQQLGATSIYVTHDQVEAMTLADRIVAMNGGHIQQVGTPLNLYDQPANLFVAGFIGSPGMNLMAGAVEGGSFVLLDGHRLTLPDALRGGDGKATLGIRPEHVQIGSDAATSDNLLTGKVELVEPTGHGILLHLAVSGLIFKLLTHDRRWLHPAPEVAFSLPNPALHLFDAEGTRI